MQVELTTTHNISSESNLTLKYHSTTNRLAKDRTLGLCWIPESSGIRGNEITDDISKLGPVPRAR